MVRLGGEKMSKSLGNLVFVHRLLEKGHDPAAIRLALLSQQLPELVGVGRPHARRGRGPTRSLAGRRPGRRRPSKRCGPALDDDLDTPGAIAAIDEEADAGRGVERRGRCSACGRLSVPDASAN